MSSQRRTPKQRRSTVDVAPSPPAAPSNSTRNRRRRATTEVEEVEDDADLRSAVGAMTVSSSARAMQSGGDREDTSDSDNDNEEFGDLHQMVLQAIMASGYLDGRAVKKLFYLGGRLLDIEIPEDNAIYPYIQKVVKEINDKVKESNMAIRSATCEITGEKFYVFLVTMDKPVMKFQNFFSKVELELFKKIMNSILRDHVNFAMSRMECLNITQELDPQALALSKLKAENFIDKLIDMKYFVKIYKDKDEDTDKEEAERDYDITLGFRAIRELEQNLREVYGNIFGNCCLCKSILLNGLQCPNAECDAVMHRGCVRKFLKNCNSCVLCQGDWKSEDDLPVRTRDSVVDEEADPPSPSTVDCSASGSSDDDRNAGGEEVGNSPKESSEPAATSAYSKKRNASPKGRKQETPKKKEEAQAPTPRTPARSSARRRVKKVVIDL